MRVRGEIANLTRAASGHWYLTLKDDQAQVRCVMFRGRNALAGFVPADGDAVEVLAQVTLYEARGEFQLNLESMQRAGAGRLFEEFLRLKARLAAEGLFAERGKRALPRVPRRIGIVTSLQAAALRDVVSVLARRAPYVQVIVYPAPVQGAGAGARIALALDTASARAEVDLVLLVRGGGSIEDLWAFNEEAVARAIRACSVPVVVGVGHESDVTIADFAADLRAPTPTAAAELAAPPRQALLEQVGAAQIRLQRYALMQQQVAQQRLDYAARALVLPQEALQGLRMRIDRARGRILVALLRHLAGGRSRVTRLRERWLAGQLDRLARARRLPQVAGLLRPAVQALLAEHRARLLGVEQALLHLDPRAVLQRGYAIVSDASGRLLLDASRIPIGASLQVQLARGVLAARVEAVQSGSDSDAAIAGNTAPGAGKADRSAPGR